MISKNMMQEEKDPRLSSVFITLLSTNFSSYLLLIMYPQLIILLPIASLLPPTPGSPTPCSVIIITIVLFLLLLVLNFRLFFSSSFLTPRFKHDPISWEETSWPGIRPSPQRPPHTYVLLWRQRSAQGPCPPPPTTLMETYHQGHWLSSPHPTSRHHPHLLNIFSRLHRPCI